LLTTVTHVQAKQETLKFNGTYHLVVYADYVNFFYKNRYEVWGFQIGVTEDSSALECDSTLLGEAVMQHHVPEALNP
jgi:hypothetical protein